MTKDEIDMIIEAPISWKLSTPTNVCLFISLANLGLLAAAFTAGARTDATPEKTHRAEISGTFAIGIALCSQMMYLWFLGAWIFSWMRFNRGNPAVRDFVYIGLILSTAACVAGVMASGLRRVAGMSAGLLTGGFWLLVGVASTAV